MNALNPQQEQERAASDESFLVKTKVEEIYALIKNGLGSIGGLDVAAGVCGTNAGDLRRSLDNDGRRVSLFQAVALGTRISRYNPSLATQIASAFSFPMGFEVFPRVTMKPEEENRLLKAKLNAIGNSIGVGAQLIADALGGR